MRVVARLVARPDKVQELRKVLLALIQPSRAEAGCVSYQMLQNEADPTDFTFVEEWKTGQAFDGHLASDHFKAAAAKLPGLVATDPDIRRYKVVA